MCVCGRFIEVKKDWGIASSERLQRLGWRYRALEDTLGDAVHSFKDAALLH